MDVLKLWQPTIDWGQFKQGAVSDRVWEHFQNLVRFCHADAYWEASVKQIRYELDQLTSAPTYERERELEEAERYMCRARFLAAEQISHMSHLVTDKDKGNADWNLCWALRIAVQRKNYEDCSCKVAAFYQFDAREELKEPPLRIAARWLEKVGSNHERLYAAKLRRHTPLSDH